MHYIKNIFTAIFSLLLFGHAAAAQNKLSIENVRTVFLRSTGPITSNYEVKGYFTFSSPIKWTKRTTNTRSQLMDENLNKVKEVQFVDSKNIILQESASDNKSILFKFYNADQKSYDCRVYGVDGKQKFSYQREVDKKLLLTSKQ